MLDQLIPWAEPTAFGLLGLAVLLVLFGFLIPIRWVRERLARERQVTEDYKAAWQAADARADKLADLLAEALPLIRQAADRARR